MWHNIHDIRPISSTIQLLSLHFVFDDFYGRLSVAICMLCSQLLHNNSHDNRHHAYHTTLNLMNSV